MGAAVSDYATEATSWKYWEDYWDGKGNHRLLPVDPVRPSGPGWKLVHVIETADSGVIGYWERKVYE